MDSTYIEGPESSVSGTEETGSTASLRDLLASPATLADSLEDRNVLSPLRYPGGKRRLAPLIAHLLRMDDFHPDLTVEPFAGGASVGLYLLVHGHTNRLGLCDADEMVAAFWQTVFFDGDWLVKAIESIEITLDKWKEMRDCKTAERRDLAMKCLFLNRTSFSGILSEKAGPLGGKEQKSKYKIDCRFPRDVIIRRIRTLQRYSDRIAFVHHLNWDLTLELVRDAVSMFATDEPFLYIDPPFFEKADKLYRHYFQASDHEKLRDSLAQNDVPWLLSYDSPADVAKLYNGKQLHRLTMLYTASASATLRTSGEALVSNFLSVDELS